MSGKRSVYQIVTDRICDQLKKGVIPWRKPWIGRSNGKIGSPLSETDVENLIRIAYQDITVQFGKDWGAPAPTPASAAK